MAKIDRSVETYEKQVGVKHHSSPQNFYKYIQRRHGKERVDELLSAIDQRAQGIKIDIYPLLFGGLDLSVDFLSLDGDLHRNFLNWRSEEHTSELQSRQYLVCRLLLEKKKKER